MFYLSGTYTKTPSFRPPILACWYVEEADYVHHPVDPVPVNKTTNAPSRIFTCRQLKNQSISEPMIFIDIGKYVFVTVFFNNVSQVSSNISFGVISGEFISQFLKYCS